MFYEINNVEYDSRRRVHTIEEYGVSSRLTNMTLHGNNFLGKLGHLRLEIFP